MQTNNFRISKLWSEEDERFSLKKKYTCVLGEDKGGDEKDRSQGVLLRSLQLNIVNRRVYSVRVALALWHMDSNHKLIRYKFFLTNCIYTYGWGMR